MKHHLITTDIINELQAIVGDEFLIANKELMYNYSTDCTSKELSVPSLVIKPGTALEISRILVICNQNKISVTVRGGGTNVNGSALNSNGLLLSTERLNKIIEINDIDRIAIVETGVVTNTLQQAALAFDLSFPQNISSADSCFIGGNIAISSGSPKSLKHGPTRNYILNLEVVLPNGQIIWTGKNIEKNATGFNLTQLFVGSEGTLGIITKAVVKLIKREKELLVMVPFSEIEKLFECVHQFFRQGFSASTMEFIDKRGYDIVSNHISHTPKFKEEVEGMLWIEFEGKNQEQLLETLSEVSDLIGQYTVEDILVAQTPDEVVKLWDYRKKIGEAVMNLTLFRDLDLVVPRSKISHMYQKLKETADKHNLGYTTFGHIGNGNFHVNIFNTDKVSHIEWEEKISAIVQLIFEAAVALGGTISGEHGIGTIQKPYLDLAIGQDQINVMKQIKNIFDSQNILNSQNIFDPE